MFSHELSILVYCYMYSIKEKENTTYVYWDKGGAGIVSLIPAPPQFGEKIFCPSLDSVRHPHPLWVGPHPGEGILSSLLCESELH